MTAKISGEQTRTRTFGLPFAGVTQPIRVKFVSSLKGRLGWQGLKADEYRDDGPYVVSSAHFDRERIRWDACPRISEQRYQQDANIQMAVADVLLMKDGAAMGKLAYVDSLPGAACLNSHLLLFRPLKNSYCPRFLFYVLRSPFFQDYISVHGTGATFLGIPQSAVGDFELHLPSLPIQSAIADFLDRKTTAIDSLIAKKERLIELLQEKRQALITQAVTKGLDRNVPVKDSGVEWLGEIPTHWRVLRMSSFASRIGNGFVGPTRDILRDTGTRYLQSLHIKSNRIRFEPTYHVDPLWAARVKRANIATGDVLVVQTGDIGQVAHVTDEFDGCACHALIIVSSDQATVAGRFLSWVLNSNYGYHRLLAIQTGALHPHLNCGYVKGVEIPVPPLEEQAAICSAVEAGIDDIDRMAGSVGLQISKLREYRQAVITEAVTGKLDIPADPA